MIGTDDGPIDFSELDGYPYSRIRAETRLVFDREEPLGLDGRLNYQIVVNWLIAEHKSQGTMQTYLNAGRYERFWFYDTNSAENVSAGTRLMTGLGLLEVQ
jgi:hypothetical protein